MTSALAETANGFLLDFSLFRVAKYIRLMGYNAVCDSQLRGREMVRRAARDNLVLITSSCGLIHQVKAFNKAVQRERGGASRKTVVAYDSDGGSIYSEGGEEADCITYFAVPRPTADNFTPLMVDVIRVLGLQYHRGRIFSRCVVCNEVLHKVSKESVKQLVHPKVYEVYDAFTQCSLCQRIFWGVDNGHVVNYTALRTLEHCSDSLKPLFLPN